MPRKWNILQIGTMIIIKGEQDIEGIIIDYFTDNKEIKGYRVKTDEGRQIIIDLDTEIEVIKR